MSQIASHAGIVALRDAIKAGHTTPQTVIDAALKRAHASQTKLKAFTYLPTTAPIVSADTVAPLAGIAVAVKDLIDTADMPTAYGSPIYRDHTPQADAWIVARLRALGAHVLGKSVTTEFAWRHPGATVNPWNSAHTPGGSSSGSAAAVAAGIVPLALGTQTLGSVIRPAAFCGIVGFKPSYGAIARTGICALSSSLDHVGVFTRSVDDAAYAISLLAGASASDTHGKTFKSFTMASYLTPITKAPVLAFLSSAQFGEIDPAQAEIMQRVAQQLRDSGAIVHELQLPQEFNDAAEQTALLAAADAARHHAHHVALKNQLSASMAALLEQGSAMSATDVAALKSRQHTLSKSFLQWFKKNQLDAVLLPPAAGEAPAGLHATGDARFCSPFTLIGVPAITLPAGFGPKGLPLGVQLVGALGADLALLKIARGCEQVIALPKSIATAWQ